jgi:hypothetical protein
MALGTNLKNLTDPARCLTGLALSGFLGLGLAGGSTTATAGTQAAADNKYIGADKCKSCHGSVASGRPARGLEGDAARQGFAALSSDAAKKIATEGASRTRPRPAE